jgi:hypothetical protein
MQIAPGQTPLSLAILKALGTQPATAAAKAAAGSTTAPESRAPAAPSSDLGAARNLPRGSFVDIKA